MKTSVMRPSSPKRCVSLRSLKNRQRVFISEKKRCFFRARFRVPFFFGFKTTKAGWMGFLVPLVSAIVVGHAGFSNPKKETILHFSNFTHLRTLTGDLYLSLLFFYHLCQDDVKMKISMRSRLLLLHPLFVTSQDETPQR